MPKLNFLQGGEELLDSQILESEQEILNSEALHKGTEITNFRQTLAVGCIFTDRDVLKQKFKGVCILGFSIEFGQIFMCFQAFIIGMDSF